MDQLPRQPVHDPSDAHVLGEGLLEGPMLRWLVLAETGGAARGDSLLHRLPVLRHREEAQDGTGGGAGEEMGDGEGAGGSRDGSASLRPRQLASQELQPPG